MLCGTVKRAYLALPFGRLLFAAASFQRLTVSVHSRLLRPVVTSHHRTESKRRLQPSSCSVDLVSSGRQTLWPVYCHLHNVQDLITYCTTPKEATVWTTFQWVNLTFMSLRQRMSSQAFFFGYALHAGGKQGDIPVAGVDELNENDASEVFVKSITQQNIPR